MLESGVDAGKSGTQGRKGARTQGWKRCVLVVGCEIPDGSRRAAFIDLRLGVIAPLRCLLHGERQINIYEHAAQASELVDSLACASCSYWGRRLGDAG